MNDSINFNLIKELKGLYSESDTAKSFFDYFSNRQRTDRVTKVYVASRNLGISEGEIREFFKELDKLEVGEFIVGRRGHSTRMEWDYNPKSLSMVAASKSNELIKVSHEDEDEESAFDSNITTHFLRLRDNFNIELNLPVDLTHEESEKLSSWVKLLSI